ncbi:cytochrome P450 [Lasiosphaeria miniovina]|uniref:Cytochrome P450 n=1 Tax=Lasiosphaeria miniovina TaxID=1954250 RepID=A0AA40DX24_9PEZI|nr:cytochrome P450 [Lasiosphaeria miniovina]KAK0716782.1 cytochrome P450 [Lasiosphaeria miniovina]
MGPTNAESRYTGRHPTEYRMPSSSVIGHAESVLSNASVPGKKRVSSWPALHRHILTADGVESLFHLPKVFAHGLSNFILKGYQQLPTSIRIMHEEISRTLDECIGAPKGANHRHHLTCVVRVDNTVFYGKELGHNDVYNENAINWTRDVVVAAALFVRNYSNWLKGLYVTLFTNINQRRKIADDILIPIVQKCTDQTARGEKVPDDLLQGFIENANPDEFDGFRFSRPNATKKTKMVNTSTEQFLFGHGRHACPGSFFAVDAMKLITKMLIERYDIKLITGTKPFRAVVGMNVVPESSLKILVKSVPKTAA